jgi:hypothetical protein
MRKKIGAGIGQLVQGERSAGDLGEDGEQSGARRRFENPVGRRDGGGRGGDQVENC